MRRELITAIGRRTGVILGLLRREFALLWEALRSRANLRLRTKFLLSFVLITSVLTCATLLVMRHSAQVQMQREIEQGARNAILTFQVVQQQHQIALSQKADLLATLASMRNGDASTIREAAEDPWGTSDADLFIIANARGKITAVHSRLGDFRIPTAEVLLRSSLAKGNSSGWWFSGTNLYHVEVQPFYEDFSRKNKMLGAVVVGRALDTKRASDLAEISASQLVFRHAGKIVLSTLSPLNEPELGHQIENGTAPQEVQVDGEQYFASSADLTPGMSPDVTLTVLKSNREPRGFLRRLNRLLLGMGLLAVLAGAALVFMISDTFMRPLTGLAQALSALEEGNFEYPLEARGGDEVAEVTRAFERMRGTLQKNFVERRELEGQLLQVQKMDAIGRLAGGVAHDFNNLLTVIKGNNSLLLDKVQPGDPFFSYTRQIESAADRAATLTRQLLAFCRMQMLQPKVIDLNGRVSEMCKLLRRLIREDIAFNFHAGQSLGRVKADPGQIEQVIMNLVVNAGDAMPSGGTLTIETHNIKVDRDYARYRPPLLVGEYVLLAVTDTGHGMDALTRARIFEPFFTTKEQGKGTGLGLATVYGVVKQSGGCIWVESEPGKGARFEVYLPRVDEMEEDAETAETTPARVRGRKTVLIAEDEEAVRELASEFVKSAGYTVLTARDGTEALAIAQKSEDPIHVLITDVVMPQMRGPELAKQLKRLRTNVRVVYMSGYLEYNRSDEDYLEDGFFLQKPFSRDTLVSKLSEALRQRPTSSPRRPVHEPQPS
jgi:signal transduction histidine kinase/CheY-like chemotaxis protein